MKGAATTVLEPRFLSRDQAAHYVGVSASTFDQEVRSGVWPPGRARGARGGRLTWDKRLLDAWADRDGGLLHTSGPEAGKMASSQVVEAAIDEEWKRCIRGPAEKHIADKTRSKAAR